MNMDINELKALISLLDDSDDEVVSIASSNILNQGLAAIPELEKAWEATLNETLQERLESVIQNIQFNKAKQDLQAWKDAGADNILEGATYLARFHFPDITMEVINKEIDKIKQDVWLELNNNLTALEKIKIINYIILKFINSSVIQQIFIHLRILILTRY